MAEQQKDNDDRKKRQPQQRVVEIFEQNKTKMFHVMQDIVEKKKYLLELKTKLRIAEEQINKLNEYNKLSETMLQKPVDFDELIPFINNLIKETQNSIVDAKKDIAALETEKGFEVESTKPNTKLARSMNKILSEMCSDNFDSILQKERRLDELKKQIEEYNAADLFKENSQQLDQCVKEYDLAKAKNMRLREMIAMSIERPTTSLKK